MLIINFNLNSDNKIHVRIKENKMSLSKDFKKPSKEYRGKPFWAWNGKLEKDEAVRQLKIFKEMGFGGAFMHSRVGLETEYLSKDWFDVVNACVEEGRKNGQELWLYDEDRWPSGAAGGLVTKDPQYRSRHLKVQISDPETFKPSGNEIALFSAEIKEKNAKNIKRINADKTGTCKGKILAFSVELEKESSWFNDCTYLDTLSEKAVNKFIEVTHEAYRKNCSKDLGSVIPGIFTDEPHYGGDEFKENEGFTQWTDAVPETFRKRYGYDLLEHLPELFFIADAEEFSKVRRDYRDCLSYLFSHNFGKLIYDWCDKNNIMYTGHVLSEGTLRSQTMTCGSTMRFYEYMHTPGIDILCAQNLKRDGGREPEILTAKQCESVRNQFRRKWMLSELYGCTGWHFTFAEHKAVGDWQAAMGVNLRCQHLAWYTMKGEAKRDYPASISFQSSWYKDYPVVEDYFSRVNLMLSQGEPVRDIGIIHPIESTWGLHLAGTRTSSDGHGFSASDPDWINKKGKAIDFLDLSIVELQDILLEEHYDFDYIDEDILANHGAVENQSLKVALAKYKTVIIPPSLSLRKTTCDILSRFIDNGGKVIFMETPEGFSKIAKCEFMAALKKISIKSAFTKNALSKVLGGMKDIRRVSIQNTDGNEYKNSYYMLREDKETGKTIVFICHNIQNHSSGKIKVKIQSSGKAYEYDAQSGNIYSLDSKEKDGYITFDTDLPGCGSRLFVIEKESSAGTVQVKSGKLKTISKTKINPENWTVKKNEPNAFPLDRAHYSLNGSAWIGPLEILKLDRVIRDVCGLRYRGGAMVQPWAREKSTSFKAKDVQVLFDFMIDEIPAQGVTLVMESLDKFKVQVNDRELSLKENGWWIDPSFKKINVPADFLQKGYNKIVLKTSYGPDSELESLYITGDFGFRRDGLIPVITPASKTIKLGDWAENGLLTYSAALSYVTEIKVPSKKKNEKIFLEVPDWNGIMIKVKVGGKFAGNIPWKPYEIDVTEFLDGKKTVSLEIELSGSRRNLLGPHHLNNPYPAWTGPYQFVPPPELCTDEYITLPCGLMKSPIISIRG